MIQHSDYVQYFRNLAQAHLDIASQNDNQFLNIDLFDESNVTSKPDGIDWKEGKCVLVLEDFERNLSQTNKDQQYWGMNGAFWVVALTGRDNKLVRGSVKDLTLDVTTQIMAMMQKNSNEDSPEWLSGLVDGSFVTQKIGPIWDGAYGWRTEFEIQVAATPDLVVNYSKWD